MGQRQLTNVFSIFGAHRARLQQGKAALHLRAGGRSHACGIFTYYYIKFFTDLSVLVQIVGAGGGAPSAGAANPRHQAACTAPPSCETSCAVPISIAPGKQRRRR